MIRKPLIDLTDKRFNRLVALTYAGDGNWNFKCDCGKIVKLKSYNVKNNNTKSCGCLLFETKNVKHGQSSSRTYSSWRNLKNRCTNQNNARREWIDNGISVCERWLESFDNFYEDMGECPKGLTIERIDNSKGYCKENCKWATYTEQNNNKKNNIIVEYNSKTCTLKQLCDELGLNYKTIYQKINRDKKVLSDLIPNTKLYDNKNNNN